MIVKRLSKLITRNLYSKLIARRALFATLLALLLLQQSLAVTLPAAAPASVGMSAARLAEMDAAVPHSIAGKEMPGAVVLFGRRGRVVGRKSYVGRAVEPTREPMTADTIFDLASLTKVVATATS